MYNKVDAWGNCTITLDTNGIGTLNPFRYRGYYYDSETNLYYLKSRYYDPATGRFLNQDMLLDRKSVLGYNLYAYCLNNPVMYGDDKGKAAITLALTGALVFAMSMYLTYMIIDDIQVLCEGIATTAVETTRAIRSWAWEREASKEKEIQKSNEPDNIVALYRAVGYIEYDRVMKNRKFDSNWDTAMGEKFFATNISNAAKWGAKLNPEGFKIIEITLLESSLNGMMYHPFLDGIGPAYSASPHYINAVMLSCRGVY